MQVRLACMGTDGDLLRAARERAGLTQGELADLVGAHRASVGNWENGTPPRNRLGKIREVLGLDEHLKAAGHSDKQDLSSMDNSELVARLNVLMSQLNATASEVARRLSLTGEPKLGQITGDTDSNPPVTPRVVMDLGDDEMSALHDDDAGEVS
jgi:DNA-binding XRE family transcriptional regulator